MQLAYFSIDDHQACHDGSNLQIAYDKMIELHKALHRRMRDHSWDLHTCGDKRIALVGRSAASSTPIAGIALPYIRSREQAQLVERLMGRETNASSGVVDLARHPVIELRLMPEHFVIELIMSPNAWWDQRNLLGKLSVSRHRAALRSILQRMEGDFRFGFWDGTALSDMHLTSRQLLRGSVLEDWMSTFSDAQDWLRVGVWYEPEAAALSTTHILNEIVERVDALYSLYAFSLYTSNNNFQSFYRSVGTFAVGRDARM